MATYCVTFRIADKTVGGKSYADRRQSLIDNTRTDDLGYWDEPTSFLLVESGLDTTRFAKKACAGLSVADDLLFVFDPSDRSACYFGAVESVDVLRSFFRQLKKVP